MVRGRSRHSLLLRSHTTVNVSDLSVVLALLAELCPRVSAHLVGPLRLAQLAAGVPVGCTGPISVIATSVRTRSRLLAGRSLDVRVRDRRHNLGDVQLLGASLYPGSSRDVGAAHLM